MYIFEGHISKIHFLYLAQDLYLVKSVNCKVNTVTGCTPKKHSTNPLELYA